MTNDVLSLPAGRELDALVDAALGIGRPVGSTRPYSTSGDEAVALAQRFGLVIEPQRGGNYVSVGNGAANGETIPHAVARWVARYVKNGEVSE